MHQHLCLIFRRKVRKISNACVSIIFHIIKINRIILSVSTAVIEWCDGSTFFLQKTFQWFLILLYLTTFQKADVFPHILL